MRRSRSAAVPGDDGVPRRSADAARRRRTGASLTRRPRGVSQTSDCHRSRGRSLCSCCRPAIQHSRDVSAASRPTRRRRRSSYARVSSAESVTVGTVSHRSLYACDGRPAHGSGTAHWCGTAYGRLEHGRLLDPRLDLSACTDAGGRPLAFAWMEAQRRRAVRRGTAARIRRGVPGAGSRPGAYRIDDRRRPRELARLVRDQRARRARTAASRVRARGTCRGLAPEGENDGEARTITRRETSTARAPPCPSTIARVSASPMPDPGCPSPSRTPTSKMRSCSSGAIPTPRRRPRCARPRRRPPRTTTASLDPLWTTAFAMRLSSA